MLNEFISHILANFVTFININNRNLRHIAKSYIYSGDKTKIVDKLWSNCNIITFSLIK